MTLKSFKYNPGPRYTEGQTLEESFKILESNTVETEERLVGSEERLDTLEDPQPYIIIASENKTWRQVVSDLGVSTIINNDPNTCLVATDSLMVGVGTSFDLDVTQAVGEDSALVSGRFRVVIVSDNPLEGTDGEIYDDLATFVAGGVVIPITLSEVTGEGTPQTLTVTILIGDDEVVGTIGTFTVSGV